DFPGADDENRSALGGGVDWMIVVVQQHAIRPALQEVDAPRQWRDGELGGGREFLGQRFDERSLGAHAAVGDLALAAAAADYRCRAGVKLVGVFGHDFRVLG